MWDEEESEVIYATPEEAATIPARKYEYLDHPADVQIHAWGANLREAYEQAALGMFGYMTDPDTVEISEVREVEAEAEDLEGLLFHFLDECLFVFSCEPFFIARNVVITEWVAGGRDGKQSEGAEEEGKEGKEEGGKVREKGKEGAEEEGTSMKENDEGKTASLDEKGKKDEGKPESTEVTEETKHRDDDGGTGGEGTSGGEAGDSGGGGVYRIRARLYGEEFQLDKHPQGTEVKAITYASMQVYNKPGQHEVFVIVDI